MAFNESSPDMGRDEIADVTDALDSSKYFKELLKELKFHKTSNPEQIVSVDGEQFKMKELETAFETFGEYVENNKDFLKEDPTRIDAYLEGMMPATGVLNTNKDLKQTAVDLARNELGLQIERKSM